MRSGKQSMDASRVSTNSIRTASCTPVGLTESTLMSSYYNRAGTVGSWRVQERIKTVSVGMVLCLHLGVDPPDVIKTVPCAKMECWCDPATVTGVSGEGGGPVRPLDVIGRNLVGQYEFWQPRARYKLAGDPTVEDVRKLMQSIRKSAKEERALVHWNGHGTPRPTKAGELWVFNRQFTQYIPLAVADIVGWLGLPCAFVIDASGAGNVYEALLACVPQTHPNTDGRLMVVMGACGGQEVLPMAPELPADLFTACLTTPLEIAIRWHILKSSDQAADTEEIMSRCFPGRLGDRKTILGELHWIFTALTDTIAWLLFPRATFKALFRQDLMMASLFRNYLLAGRVMGAYGCTPVSWPVVPVQCSTHRLWQCWDHVLDETISNGGASGATGRFFTEQMDAFEAWLDDQWLSDPAGAMPPCEYLPMLLQVLLSQSHRTRALHLLTRHMDLHPAQTCHETMEVGCLPYLLKLLQSPCPEVRPALLGVWVRVLAFDGGAGRDLGKDAGYLQPIFQAAIAADGSSREEAVMALLCLAVIASEKILALQPDFIASLYEQATRLLDGDVELLLWTVNCLASLLNLESLLPLISPPSSLLSDLLLPLAKSSSWQLRSAACHLLSATLSIPSPIAANPIEDILPQPLLDYEQDAILHMTGMLLADASESVRSELAICLSNFCHRHTTQFALAAFEVWEGKDGGAGHPVVSGDVVRNPSVYAVLWEAVLALAMDPSEAVSRLASSIVDDIHLSFLHLVAESEPSQCRPASPSELKEPIPTTSIPPSNSPRTSLPLPSSFIAACHQSFLEDRRSKQRQELMATHGYSPSGQEEVRERAILARHLGECTASKDNVRFDRQVALLAHGSLATRLAFHPLLDLLIVADTRNRLSVWDWEANTKIDFFVNGNPERTSQISGLLSLPHHRLLVSSTDGVVRCWSPDYGNRGDEHSAQIHASHQMFTSTMSGGAGGNSVFEIDYDSSAGCCYGVASDDGWVRGWDLAGQTGFKAAPLAYQATPTALRVSRHDPGLLFVGYSSGALSIHDLRSPTAPPQSRQAHDGWLVDICESPIQPHQLITASVLGDLSIMDRRNPSSPLLRYDLLAGHAGLLTFAGHEVLPVLAVGSTDHILRFLSLGRLVSMDPSSPSPSSPGHAFSPASASLVQSTVKYHEGLFGQRIGAPSSAAFHPNRPLYAAASSDTVVALYSTTEMS